MSNRNHNRNNNNNNHNEPRDEPLSMDAESSETGDTTSTAANNNILYESMAAPSAAVNNNNVAEIPVDIRTGIPIRNRHANANARSVSALAVMNHQAMLRLQSPPVACGRSTSLTGTAAGTGAGAAGMNPSLNSNNNLRAATLRLDDLNLNLNHNNNNNNNNNNHSNVIPEQDVALLEFPTDGGDSSSCSSSNNNAGWSIVETNGGTPPSARSLHAAAYLNGIYYVFGGKLVLCTECWYVGCIQHLCLFTIHSQVTTASNASIPFMPFLLPKNDGRPYCPLPMWGLLVLVVLLEFPLLLQVLGIDMWQWRLEIPFMCMEDLMARRAFLIFGDLTFRA
jgi:hypothetical protein